MAPGVMEQMEAVSLICCAVGAGDVPCLSSLVARAWLHARLQVGLESVPSDPQHTVKWRCLSHDGFQVTVMQNLLMHTRSRGRAFQNTDSTRLD